MAYIELKNVKKKYLSGEVEVFALDGVDLEIKKGEFVVIVGASGAGKTTLLNILGGMDKASSGVVKIDSKDIEKFSKKELTKYRRNDIGFVFQFYNLIPNLTAYENVEIATQICEKPFDVLKVIEDVGLSHRLNNFPAQLSGGEQQRVSIARAIAKNPKLLLCDEPTGALDYETGITILSLLKMMSKKYQMTVVIITHNHAITPIFDRVIEVKSGKISKIITNEFPVDVESIEW